MEEKPLLQWRDVSSFWAFLNRMHRNGVLYLVVPFSFILILFLSAAASFTFGLPLHRIPGFSFFAAPELAVYYLSIPLLFAVLNPSGIVRGLAAASLGLALASVGYYDYQGEERYLLGQRDLWKGLPLGPVMAGLLQIPVGAALVYAGYRGNWHIHVRVTAAKRALLILTGSALIVWGPAEMLFYEENTGFAVAVALAFLCIGLLMQRYRWPRWPLLTGFIVGAVVERYSIIAVFGYGLPGALARPLPIALTVMLLALVVWSYRLRRSGAPSEDVGGTGFRPEAALQGRNILPVLGIAVGAVFWWGSLGFEDVQSWFLPRVAGMAVMAFCLLELLLDARNQQPRSNARSVSDIRDVRPPAR